MNDKVVIEGEEINVELSANQKYAILKQYWAHYNFNMD